MNAIKKAIVNGAIAILWNKKTLKFVVRLANEALAKKVSLQGKEFYAQIITDSFEELRLRGQCVSDDGIVSPEENEKVIAFDESLVDKYWGLKMKAFLLLAVVVAVSGCFYKGGKIVDGTNLAVGITVPGTEFTINALDYIGGLRVAGNDSTHIVVTNRTSETNDYFGIITTRRTSDMSASIEPLGN